MTGRGDDGDDPGRPGGGSAKGVTTGKGAGASGRPEASTSGAGGPQRTSTPAKTRGRTSRRSSLTATSEFLQKEQQVLDKLDKEKTKKGNTRVPSETQTKIANYLKKVKESKETKKEEAGLQEGPIFGHTCQA